MDAKHWVSIGITLSCLVVVCITTSFAYFVASIEANNINETNFESATLGSIKYDGQTTFNETEIYPGMKYVQTFTIEKGSQEGQGVYEIDLEGVIPEEFKNDVTITLYKTTNPTTNNVTRVEGSLAQTAEGFVKEDTITINGSLEKVYGPNPLTNSSEIILEQAEFDTKTLEKTTYYLVYEYKDNGNQNTQQGKTFSGKVTVKLIAEKAPTIEEQIISQLDTTGKCPEVNEDGTVNITKTESTNGYLCSAPDDYGTSYYYRGNVENNWVKFAGYYWRILRINGDGSIRMIYAGDASVIDALDNKEEVLKNGYNDSSTDYTQIGTSAYSTLLNDNTYVGYMYASPKATTYNETHANINDNVIKEKIDEWYETHIQGTEYEGYLSDTLFCNDRSLSPNSEGNGVGSIGITYYRWGFSEEVTLICNKINDRFTVNDEVTGNGDLTYPIGLLSTDEAYFAGGYDSSNATYYLYTGNNYWTMSPINFFSNSVNIQAIGYSGTAFGGYLANQSLGVRPVINLKHGSLTKGSGTANDPYMVY
mgnify:CR=1 FL=1